jgi:hypothetical protein
LASRCIKPAVKNQMKLQKKDAEANGDDRLRQSFCRMARGGILRS